MRPRCCCRRDLADLRRFGLWLRFAALYRRWQNRGAGLVRAAICGRRDDGAAGIHERDSLTFVIGDRRSREARQAVGAHAAGVLVLSGAERPARAGLLGGRMTLGAAGCEHGRACERCHESDRSQCVRSLASRQEPLPRAPHHHTAGLAGPISRAAVASAHFGDGRGLVIASPLGVDVVALSMYSTSCLDK